MSRCASEQVRRRRPRPLDADWLVLKGLRTAIACVLGSVARPGGVALDFGCGSRPYEQLFTAAGMRYLGADFGDEAELDIDPTGWAEGRRPQLRSGALLPGARGRSRPRSLSVRGAPGIAHRGRVDAFDAWHLALSSTS